MSAHIVGGLLRFALPVGDVYVGGAGGGGLGACGGGAGVYMNANGSNDAAAGSGARAATGSGAGAAGAAAVPTNGIHKNALLSAAGGGGGGAAALAGDPCTSKSTAPMENGKKEPSASPRRRSRVCCSFLAVSVGADATNPNGFQPVSAGFSGSGADVEMNGNHAKADSSLGGGGGGGAVNVGHMLGGGSFFGSGAPNENGKNDDEGSCACGGGTHGSATGSGADEKENGSQLGSGSFLRVGLPMSSSIGEHCNVSRLGFGRGGSSTGASDVKVNGHMMSGINQRQQQQRPQPIGPGNWKKWMIRANRRRKVRLG